MNHVTAGRRFNWTWFNIRISRPNCPPLNGNQKWLNIWVGSPSRLLFFLSFFVSFFFPSPLKPISIDFFFLFLFFFFGITFWITFISNRLPFLYGHFHKNPTHVKIVLLSSLLSHTYKKKRERGRESDFSRAYSKPINFQSHFPLDSQFNSSDQLYLVDWWSFSHGWLCCRKCY